MYDGTIPIVWSAHIRTIVQPADRPEGKRLVVIISVILLAISAIGAGFVHAKSSSLKGSLIYSEIGASVASMGLKCDYHVGNERLTVTQVKISSPAYYEGISPGDIITSIYTTKRGHEAEILRSGKYYCFFVQENSGEVDHFIYRSRFAHSSEATMKVAAWTCRDQTGLTARTPINPKSSDRYSITAENQVDTPKITQLPYSDIAFENYDIELILDSSGSMKSSAGVTDMSRFAWASAETIRFAKELSRFSRNATLTLFNGRWTTAQNCSLDEVSSILLNTSPTGGDDLYDALNSRIEDLLRTRRNNRRPKLFIVMEDDYPETPPNSIPMVYELLSKLSVSVQLRNEIVVMFLQVGPQTGLFDNADQQARQFGASYAIARTLSFQTVCSDGLASAIRSELRRTR